MRSNPLSFFGGWVCSSPPFGGLLRVCYAVGMIDRFYTKEHGHTILSNFWEGRGFDAPSPQMREHVLHWPSAEHLYQASKTEDRFMAETIREASTPGLAKKLGQGVNLRSDWEQVKIGVMREVLHWKFTPGSLEAAYLLSTKDHLLVEGNWWGDRFWGQVDGVGANWLGWLLMAQRSFLASLERE